MIAEFAPPFSDYAPTLSLRSYKVLFVLFVAVAALAGVVSVMASRRRRGTAAAGRRSPGEGSGGSGSEPDLDPSPGAGGGGRGFDLAGLAFFAALAYLSLLARRNVALFALGAAPFVGQCVLVLKRHAPHGLARLGSLASAATAVALVAALAAATWFVTSNRLYDWNGEVAAFGPGLLEENFPIRAAAFAREMALPTHLYADMSGGSYLAWDRPLGEGVYIDGRLEVYDADFFAAYLEGMDRPDLWQVEADRVGINTVLVHHRWPVHKIFIQSLNRDPRWALVYVDEVAVIFVRQAGNEGLIERARERFAPIFLERVQSLMQPVAGWQRPTGRTAGVTHFAETLLRLGNVEWGLRLLTASLDLGLTPRVEAEVRVILAEQFAARGETALARMHLDRAAKADPTNPNIPQLRSEIGR